MCIKNGILYIRKKDIIILKINLYWGRVRVLNKIEKTKKKLEKNIDLRNINCEEILEISEEIDELIVEYYKNNRKYNLLK